ncbi:DUF6192 family protein [Streptomyces europaeiscabiei]|uniref:DUF6192 family protein n=1 Tax=Streptomyces europaeiscabiei TaxID=146819 RepID=UPI0029BAD147|nr:DUF6192 family protein [Streptomyces europaeiscabiei]MDX3783490.1 DUF6192 family protein [Streptomyces europaeiscabiei]
MFAEDVGLAYTTVRSYRWVSSRWAKERRRADVSHTIHKILASIPDEQERFEAVTTPPRPARAADRPGGRMTARSGSWAGRSTPRRASRRRSRRSTTWPPTTRSRRW